MRVAPAMASAWFGHLRSGISHAADFRQLLLNGQLIQGAQGQRREGRDPLVTSAWSATPQCAVTGWPGQTGQTSAAALSQTVKMKSNCGASASVCHDLERSSRVL